MEDLNKYSPTEILKMINDTKTNHDELKEIIIIDTKHIDELTITINENLINLDIIEKTYISLIEELNNR